MSELLCLNSYKAGNFVSKKMICDWLPSLEFEGFPAYYPARLLVIT
jgi:hypothetical protein